VLGELGDASAIEYAKRALKLGPNNPSVLNTVGMLLVKRGDANEALQYLERAAKLAPNRPALRLDYAKGLIKAGRKDEARRELTALQGVKEEFTGKSEIADLIKAL